MKKKLITLLLCAMLMSTVGCASAENTPAPTQAPETDTATATELSAADAQNAGDQTAEQASETVSDTVSSTEKTSSDTQASSEASPSKEAQTSNDKEEADAKSTPTASPEAEPSGSPTPSPTPSFEVERWDEEKTMYAKAPVNVRKGPSKEYELCGYLGGGEAAVVRGTGDTGWYLIALGDEEGFVSNHYLLDTPPAPAPAPVEAPAAPVAPAAPQPAAPQPQAPAPVAPPTPAPTAAPPKVVASTIFVGDSRFVQMHEAVGETGVTWICENSKGYKWFEENAVPRIDNLVGKGTKSLINLGVNDPEHHYSYINLVNGKAAEWTQKGATVYYASVNPVWDNPYTTKEEVITFNSKVSAGLVGVHWIDSYTFLNENGYRIVDGLHYSPETSAVLYNYYITCIQ